MDKRRQNSYSLMLTPLIVNFCAEKKWPYAEFAREANISKSTLENIINNVTRNPSIGLINKIAIAMGISLSQLIQDAGINDLSKEEADILGSRTVKND